MMTTTVERRFAFGDISNTENIPPVGDRKTKNAVEVPRQPLAERVSMTVLHGGPDTAVQFQLIYHILQIPHEEHMITDEEEKIRRIRELEKEEPLLQENPRRFVMFPIQHSDIWQFYKKAEGRGPSPPFLTMQEILD